MITYIFNILLTMIKWVHFVYWYGKNYNMIKIDKLYAKQLKNKLMNLGILGIKFGQYICTRSDITTEIMKEELKVFLSNNIIHSMKDTNIILEKAGIINNITLGEVIGSGSLSQVYKCQLKNNIMQGQDLVIKVNHMNTSKLRYEICAVKNIIKLLSCFNKFKVFINIDWNTFFNMLEKQIDLNNEKKNMEKYYSIYNNITTDITVPQYIMGNEDYIIMTYCEGKLLNTYARDSMQYKKAHNLVMCSTIHTLFLHYIIHGDCHEGNILVRDDGSISIIDFGICIEHEEEDITGIIALSQFENNPTNMNCYKLLKATIKPYDIYNNSIDINKISDNICKSYNINKNIKLHDTVKIIEEHTIKNNVLIKSNFLTYLINIVLLESLSPYNEKIDMSTIIAITYMKTNNFLIKDFHIIDEYYNNLVKKIPSELIQKYNLE